MADFRTVQTRMWREDNWFMDQPLDARLFWIYLFTNPSASICGMYRLPLRTMVFESGLTEKRINELFKAWAKDRKAYYEDGIVWVVRMRENQLGDKISENQEKGIAKDLAKIPVCPLKNRYLLHYGYPTDTLSDAPDTLCIGALNDTDTDTLPNDTDTHAQLPSLLPAPKPSAEAHKAIMTAYREIVGYKLTTEPAENKAAQGLAKLGYTPEQVIACYRHMKVEPFWAGKHLGLASVAKQIGAYVQAHRTNGHSAPPPVDDDPQLAMYAEWKASRG